MKQLKFSVNIRFFIYLLIILIIPIAIFLFQKQILNTYKSFSNNPYNVRVTNLTDKSATLSWYTQTPDTGIVKLNNDVVGYDDRDVEKAFQELVKTKSSQEISKIQKSEIKVTNPSKYYVHHITIQGLNSDTQYSFNIQSDFKTWKFSDMKSVTDWYDLPVLSSFNFKTLIDDEATLQAPQPAYGSVTVTLQTDEKKPSSDSIIFAQAYKGIDLDSTEPLDEDTPISNTLSSVTNSQGGWAIDKSNFKTSDGKALTGMQTGFDRLYVYAQLENLSTSPGRFLLWNTQDSPDQDFNYQEWNAEKFKEEFSSKIDNITNLVYAEEKATEETVKYAPLCCALDISGKKTLVGDYEKKDVGADCAVFDVYKGKSLYGGTYQNATQVKGLQDRALCEHQWNSSLISNQNASYDNPGEVPPICCILTINGKLKGDFEDAGTGTDCNEIFNGKTFKSGTVTKAEKANNIYNRQICETTKWTKEMLANQNIKYVVDETKSVTPPTTTPPTTTPPTTTPPTTTPPTTTPPSSNNSGTSGTSSTSGLCCIIKTEDSRSRRDFEPKANVGSKSCEQVWKGTYGNTGKKIVSANQYSAGNSSRDACEGGSSSGTSNNTSGGVSGVPCDTSVPDQNVPGVDKTIFAEKCALNAGTDANGKPKGHSYGKECFNDVVYRAKMAGVNPKLALITWMHESGCSNYEAAPKGFIEDFGIHYSDSHLASTTKNSHFNEQINEFMCWSGHSLYKQCNASDPLVGWASYFWTGSTCDTSKGAEWIRGAKGMWAWFANPSDFPTSIKDYGKDNFCSNNKKKYVGVNGNESSSLFESIFRKTFAQETDTNQGLVKTDPSGDKYTLYFTQDGLYDVDIDGYKVYSVMVNKDNEYTFFKNINGKDGYQENEDELLQADVSKIRVDKVAKTFSVDLKKGFNLISFPFLPTADNYTTISASDLISLANQNSNGIVKGVVEFEGGKWSNTYIYDPLTSTTMGTDFVITYGKGYALLTYRDGIIQIPGSDIIDPIPVYLTSGWNLVGIHGYQQSYTAQGLITSMNKIESVDVQNISTWDPTKGRYDGLQVKNGQTYGFDFRISQDLGYFVNVKTTNSQDDLTWQGE